MGDSDQGEKFEGGSMTATSVRVPLVVPGTRPELADIESRILAERGRISLLYQVLLNSEPIASGWEQMLTAVRNKTSVPADLRELMILRVAVLNEAPFEFEAHIPHALKAGVPQSKIDGLKNAELQGEYTVAERLALRLTDHMTRDVKVPDDVMEQLGQQYSAREVVELVATVAAYNMVSRFLVALHIQH
jgi:alkylhydroperoxidase family enzyme